MTKILCVHGLGGHPDEGWMEGWKAAIAPHLPQGAEYRAVLYDPLFKSVNVSAGELFRGASGLLLSGLTAPFRRPRGLGDVPDFLRFYIGYVAAWLEDEEFKHSTRELIIEAVHEFEPDVILAHSLGSLLTYDAFAHGSAQAIAAQLARARYVTFGSQINHPFVSGNLTRGRVSRLAVHRWVHLFNKHDRIFTWPLLLPGAANFRQISTEFDKDTINHRASEYLGHKNTAAGLWRPLIRGEDAVPTTILTPRALGPSVGSAASRVRKALLVGINDYPDPKQRLEGCVNDVFSMSAVLQECGFEPDEIRICLDERATTEAVLERLNWLLADARPGDELVFYWSGHGASLADYDLAGRPSQRFEALVTHDFDWSLHRAITDDQIYTLYSQLPFGVIFVMIIDCCHSGGMHRDGSNRARGMEPPDDIRHRELRWDVKEKMWVPRDLQRLDAGMGDRAIDYCGEDGATARIGRSCFTRSALLHSQTPTQPGVEDGPFLPLILEACSEKEFSYEYRHGATSYGAFTFCLASVLREEKKITFRRLVDLTQERLARLRYPQTPQILGPSAWLDAEVPWNTGGALDRAVPTGEPGGSTSELSG